MRSLPPIRTLWPALAVSAFLPGCVPNLPLSECRPNPAQNLLSEINQAREREGVPPLWVDIRLAEAAASHAQALAEGRASGHFGSDGSDPLKRIEEAGYPPLAFGENTAAGSLAPDKIVEAWLASPAHRQVLLAPSYQEVGLGGVLDTQRPIWVADFGSEKDPPITKCHPWPISGVAPLAP
jgi:uncharacterized protein YkwD